VTGGGTDCKKKGLGGFEKDAGHNERWGEKSLDERDETRRNSQNRQKRREESFENTLKGGRITEFGP